jgi:8-oxo-dGTP diphosphatase
MGLVERFDGVPLARVLSSPALRCRQTAEPIAARFGLSVEADARLAEGASLSGALSLVRSLGSEPALLSCHGDLIPEIVEKLVPGALALEGGAGCPKGSTWLLQDGPRSRARASYLPPPRAGASNPEQDEVRRIAVVDLGSTSFTLLVADVTTDGHVVRIAREREMLRLGAALAQESKFSDELCERAVDAARPAAAWSRTARERRSCSRSRPPRCATRRTSGSSPSASAASSAAKCRSSPARRRRG